MKTLLIATLGIMIFQSQGLAEGRRNQGAVRVHQSAMPKSNFPKYPEAANHRGESTFARKVPSRPDSLGNHVTEDHLNRVEFAHGRAENVMKPNIHVTDVVQVGRARYATFYRPEFEQRNVVINGYIQNY